MVTIKDLTNPKGYTTVGGEPPFTVRDLVPWFKEHSFGKALK